MIDDYPSVLFGAEAITCRRGARIIFGGLDFSLRSGEALFLLGPNGSGKSSLLRLLAGLLAPLAGRLTWNGKPVAEDREAHAARLHYVGHHDAVKTVLTVAENLGFWARLHNPAADQAHTASALQRFGLHALRPVPGQLLSAGQKRRLNLARLLAAPAPLWLLDEPSVGLDRDSVTGLESVIADHRQRGGMVILSTHAEIAVPGAGTLRLDHLAPMPDDGLAEGWE